MIMIKSTLNREFLYISCVFKYNIFFIYKKYHNYFKFIYYLLPFLLFIIYKIYSSLLRMKLL